MSVKQEGWPGSSARVGTLSTDPEAQLQDSQWTEGEGLHSVDRIFAFYKATKGLPSF